MSHKGKRASAKSDLAGVGLGPEGAILRKYKRTFDIIVAQPELSGKNILGVDGRPVEPKLKFGVFKVGSVKDLATLDRLCRSGMIQPVPSLSLQIFNIMVELLGLMEDKAK